MFRVRSCALAVLAFSLIATAAFAAEAPSAPSASSVSSASSSSAPSASHLKAAEEVLAILDMETTLAETVDSTLRLQIEANPMLQDFEDIMRAFLKKYLGWQSIKGPLVGLYAESFTETELRDLRAFYRTPLGAKVAKLLPVLFEKGAKIGQDLVEEHQGELEAAIGKRIEELNAANGEAGEEMAPEDETAPADELMEDEVPAEEPPAEQSTDAPPAP